MERPAAPVGPIHHRRHGKARAIGSRHGADIGETERLVAVPYMPDGLGLVGRSLSIRVWGAKAREPSAAIEVNGNGTARPDKRAQDGAGAEGSGIAGVRFGR